MLIMSYVKWDREGMLSPHLDKAKTMACCLCTMAVIEGGMISKYNSISTG